MLNLDAGTVMPTTEEDAAIIANAMAVADTKPYTDAEWEQVNLLVLLGRRLGSGTKAQVTLHLDAEVVRTFKASGDDWQTRINDALKSWSQTHRVMTPAVTLRALRWKLP
jgi:uncharacterized protein (DUF4415 family)